MPSLCMNRIWPQPASTVEIMMAITRVRSTLMPEELATVRFWPTARNFWPRRVFMMKVLNAHSSSTKIQVITGTVILRPPPTPLKMPEMAGMENTAAITAAMAMVVAMRLALAFLRRYFTTPHSAISAQMTYSAVMKGI